MGKGLSIRAYAEHRKTMGLHGSSPWSVKKAIRDNRITRDEDGKIDPEVADRQWDQNTDPAQQRGPREPPSNVKSRPAPGPDSPLSGIPSYSQSRAVKEAYQARIARLQYEEMTSQLVRADSVKVEAFRRARMIRDQILAIPDRMASILAAEDDDAEIHRLLETEFRVVLEVLADD